jgi:hypothetical protein
MRWSCCGGSYEGEVACNVRAFDYNSLPFFLSFSMESSEGSFPDGTVFKVARTAEDFARMGKTIGDITAVDPSTGQEIPVGLVHEDRGPIHSDDGVLHGIDVQEGVRKGATPAKVGWSRTYEERYRDIFGPKGQN